MLPVTEETLALWDHIATAALDYYPHTTDDGRTVWACCESAVGRPCEHERAPDGSERNTHNPRACDRHLTVDCPTCIGERSRERVRDAWL